jgi:hypothetical protein
MTTPFASAKPRGGVKTTIKLPADAMDALRGMALERDTTFAEVIRRALTVDRYLAEATKSGGKILVEDAEKNVKELVIV